MISDKKPTILWNYIGRTEFEICFSLQEDLRDSILAGKHPSSVILTEHHKTFTFGKRESGTNLLASEEELAGKGFSVVKTTRGGMVTYHGPGQLIIYPILNLRDLKLKVKKYVEKLELSVIDLLGTYKINAERREGYPGAWIDKKKIGSLGIHVKKMVTMHGFALNVKTDLEDFKYINPCGFESLEITSIEKEGIKTENLEKLALNYMNSFSKIFGLEVEKGNIQNPVSCPVKIMHR